MKKFLYFCWVKAEVLVFHACPDDRGGFHLQPVNDELQGRQLIQDLERLCLSNQQSGHLPPSRAFTPLMDVHVDNYTSSSTLSRSPSPSPIHSYTLTESPCRTKRCRQHHHSPNRGENGTSWFDDVSLLSVSDGRDVAPERGRSPVRNGHGRARREVSPDSLDGRLSRQEEYTEVRVRVPSQQLGQTPLADVFEPQRERSPSTGRGSSEQLNRLSQNGVKRRATLQPEEYGIKTFTITKVRPSLGEYTTETHVFYALILLCKGFFLWWKHLKYLI